MSAFILAPGAPTPAPALNLLPFSLTPLPATAPVSKYFLPRPAPTRHLAEGYQIASFRGRQVVGQSIAVPRGYRGVLLRADAPPGGSKLLTPASSIASTSSEAVVEEIVAGRSTRAATKARGSGQVALSRPRTRARGVPLKRVKLEDEDDEEDEPRKRTRSTARDVKTPEPSHGVPVINVVTATPGSAPVQGSAESEAPILEQLPPVEEAVKLEATAEHDAETLTAAPELDSIDGRPPRILTPVGSFESFMLWTPDAPLAGFRQDEGDEVKPEAFEDEDETQVDESAPSQAGVSLERGWWRTGGAGEGGDEFVRALGEWLGLNEIIHTPLYLKDVDDDDDE